MSNEKRFTVFDGPNREQLMDAFRMQYLKGRSAPYVTFTIVSQGKKQKVGFHPTAVEYEDDIGDSFSIKGRLFFLKGDPKKKVMSGDFYTIGTFSTKDRHGTLTIRG